MANVVINDFSSQTVSQADDSFVIQEAGGTTKKMSKLLLAQSIAYAGYKSYDTFTATRPSVSTVTVGWAQLGIEGIIAGAQSLTLDITASGLLGLDTGSENADAWYYIYAIAKTDGTVSAIFSASSTAPTMPAGYTLKRLVSMVRNTSGDFIDFFQYNNSCQYVNALEIYSNSVAGAVSTDIDARTKIPAILNLKKVSIYASVSGQNSDNLIDLSMRLASSDHSTQRKTQSVIYNSVYFTITLQGDILTTGDGYVSYYFTSTGAYPTTSVHTVNCHGFEIPL